MCKSIQVFKCAGIQECKYINAGMQECVLMQESKNVY